MTAIVHLLFTHPRVHQKLVSILEEAIPDGMPTHHQVKDIPYLQATIDEGCVVFPSKPPLFFYFITCLSILESSLRIYAPAAIGLQRTVPEGGAMCCGQYFPAGVGLLHPHPPQTDT